MRSLPLAEEDGFLVGLGEGEEARVNHVADVHMGEVLNEVIKSHPEISIVTGGNCNIASCKTNG